MTKGDINFTTLPDEPGVYFFHCGDVVEYVGKATSLRSRVRSYFDPDLDLKRGPVVQNVVRLADRVTYQQTDSVLEALLLEAQLIKELKPKGNTMSKDDKSFNYVVVTNEPLPRILTLRGRELAAKIAPQLRKKVYGPFTQGASLREALKIIRRIFPYFDTTYPLTGTYTPQAAKHLRFNQSIGLFPAEDRATYQKTVRHICYLFEGKKKALLKSLERDMQRAARAEQFETANALKRQLFALTHLSETALLKDEYRTPRSSGFRIEAYDTAHLGGSAARAVMTVVVDGEPDTSQYRIFTIRSARAGDDFAALTEVLERRLTHTEWPLPQLIVIDGGRTHLTHAARILKAQHPDIELCAVVKDARHKAREILGKRTTAHHHKASILLANAEAHRFSLARHRRALRKRVQ
jgi:excinuclease ABC subunit C